MKLKTIVLSIVSALAFSLPVSAAEKKHDPNDHIHEKKVAGPNGGRIITTATPRAEFFVLPDRKVQITFLDQAGKAIPPADQLVTIVAGERMSPTTLTFSKSGNKLISNAALPKGDEVPAVVQIKSAPDANAVTEKFTVDLAKCSECKLAEYACICGH